MRASKFVIGGWMILIVLTLPHAAWGSCPRPGPVPTAYKRAALVFVGEVETMRPEAGPSRSGVITRVAFRVIEMFKGTRTEKVTLVLWPSSEEFEYSTGQRVLVYANRDRGFWSTACTRTKKLVPKDLELKELAALSDKSGELP